MTNQEYHADVSRIGKSGLDLIHQSPRHYWAKYLDPNRVREEPTQALRIGTATHHAVLEPEKFESKYVKLDDAQLIQEIGGANPRATNCYKEWMKAQLEAANAKKQVILTADDYDTCVRLRDAVWSHPAAAQLLYEGDAEQTFLFEEPTTGAACKCRPDFISAANFIVDLKTTEDASPAGFAKSVWNYRYHVQAPFYLDGYMYATGEQLNGFVFIAVEKSPPYAVGVYFVPDEILRRGRDEYLEDLAVYVKCVRKNEWPAYGDIVQPLQLPPWAYRKQSNF